MWKAEEMIVLGVGYERKGVSTGWEAPFDDVRPEVVAVVVSSARS